VGGHLLGQVALWTRDSSRPLAPACTKDDSSRRHLVFRYPKDLSETFLKRVTALGGDQLEIKNGVLYVNSKPVQEPYAVHHAPVHNPRKAGGNGCSGRKLFVMATIATIQ